LSPFRVIASSRSAACACLAAWLVACAGPDAGPESVPEPGTVLRILDNGTNPAGTCPLYLPGGATVSADPCPGAGSARVLVRLASGATCASMLATLAGAAPDVTAGYQFSSAPAAVQDRFCVFESPASGVAAVPRLLSALCPAASVELAMHDCSSDPLVPSPTDPGAFVAPEGQVAAPAAAVRPLALPAADLGIGTDGGIAVDTDTTHGCDTCAIVAMNTLFVNVPLAMTATADATMVVRFLNSSQPDQEIVAPAGAQSFTVPNIGVADSSAVRIYAPGQTPPPK
jgi:hypothetical protein